MPATMNRILVVKLLKSPAADAFDSSLASTSLIMSIERLVEELTNKDVYYSMYKLMHSHASVRGCLVTSLKNCLTMEFPELVRDRHIFAYRNGVYCAPQVF
eukprot:tig00021339_g20392.t1